MYIFYYKRSGNPFLHFKNYLSEIMELMCFGMDFK